MSRRFFVFIGIFLFVLLGIIVFVAARSNTQTDELTLLQLQHQKWINQHILDYDVTYTNCDAVICCENITMQVRDGKVERLIPACSRFMGRAGTLHVQGKTIDEMFLFLESLEKQQSEDSVHVEYHPDLHYIAYVYVEVSFTQNITEIRYEKLQRR